MKRTRTDPVSLEAYVAAAQQLRAALMPLAECDPERRARMDGEVFERARQARTRFLSSASVLARRERKLAAHWENAAALRYRHGRDAFVRAEDLGNRLISNLAGGRRPTPREIHELEDACATRAPSTGDNGRTCSAPPGSPGADPPRGPRSWTRPNCDGGSAVT